MRIGGRLPSKILMARATGSVYQLDFVPTYNKNGQMDKGEPVPYRLTRNLAVFFSPFGVEGAFLGAMAAAAQVCSLQN
jgi:transformation/transcription domain-associated protein